MKVLVISTSPYPIGNVTTNRVHYLCKGLIEQGIDLELLIAHPTETSRKNLNHNSEGVYDTVRYRYSGKLLRRDGNLCVRKIIDCYCHLLTIKTVSVNSNHYDLFLVIGPSTDFRILLPMAARFSKRKIILEINEYPFIGQRNNILTKIKRFIFFNTILKLYDGFIVISTTLSELMEKYKSPKSKCIVIPIIGDSINKDVSVDESPLNVPYIIHTGSIDENKDGIIGSLQAFKYAIDILGRPLNYVITGDVKGTPHYVRVKEFLKKNHLDSLVIFTGYLDNYALDRYLNHSLLAIINKKENMQNHYCFPTKLINYLSHEIPVIATSVGDLQIYLHEGITAYIVEPEDPTQLASRIIRVINRPEESETIAKNGKMLVEREFNYSYQGKRLFDFILSMF